MAVRQALAPVLSNHPKMAPQLCAGVGDFKDYFLFESIFSLILFLGIRNSNLFDSITFRGKRGREESLS
jgi:hypothetical protein